MSLSVDLNSPKPQIYAEELELQFLSEIRLISPVDWLTICYRFEEDEFNIIDSQRKISVILSKHLIDLFGELQKDNYRVNFNRWKHQQMEDYFSGLQQTIDADGRPYLLQSTAFEAATCANRSFILLDDRIRDKDKINILVPCLRPFHNFVTLPPLDYDKKIQIKAQKLPKALKYNDKTAEKGAAFHFSFPEKYFIYNEPLPKNIKIIPRHFNTKQLRHKTWHFNVYEDLVGNIGGPHEGVCKICKGPLSHLITIPRINGLPYQKVDKLTIATCLSCVGWIDEPLFFKHNFQNKSRQIEYENISDGLGGENNTILPAIIHLCETPKKWESQKWEDGDDQNLYRLGGKPSWIEGRFQFVCPDCKKEMKFLLQLDSDLPTVDGQRWLWGSGGILYVFWCEDCYISGQTWQCS